MNFAIKSLVSYRNMAFSSYKCQTGDLALKVFRKLDFKIKNLTIFHPILIKSRSPFLSEKKINDIANVHY